MTRNFVPRDIFIQHEHEWQAVRDAVERRIDLGKRETPSASAAVQASKPGITQSAAQGC